MTAPEDVPVRDAATVMLVRDGDAGLEVFMVRRHVDLAFAGGAYVFPGGAVDPEDRHADLEPVCEGRTDAEASRLLGIDDGGLAFWVAAIRECFEEAVVLLAHRPDGSIVRLDDPDVAARFAAHRDAVNRGERRLVEMCAAEGLRLAVGEMQYFSHWITPVGMPRRFDTRFFVAAAPEGQEPLHDEGETVANCWVRPAEALAAGERGEFDLIFPTIRSLEAIARFQRAGDLLAAAAAVTDVPTLQPRIVEDEGGSRIALPGDPGYGEAAATP
jgi:8-oxo-dGTP pyrophosphatase MutT (NUDIX family)